MTEQYKVGDEFLVSLKMIDIRDDLFFLKCHDGTFVVNKRDIYSRSPIDIDGNVLSHGDECEFWDRNRLRSSQGKLDFVTIPFDSVGEYQEKFCDYKGNWWIFCRKITKPKTIDIDGKTYNADEVRERLKELKPLEKE